MHPLLWTAIMSLGYVMGLVGCNGLFEDGRRWLEKWQQKRLLKETELLMGDSNPKQMS